MRVLHLIDAAGPQASPTTLALLNESLGRLGRVEERVLLLGGEPLRRAARAAGVRPDQALGVPYGRAVLGWPALRRRVHELGPFDLIHCWSIGAFTWASLAQRQTPRALTLTVAPEPRAAHWLRMLLGEGGTAGAPAVILPISSTLRRAVLSSGVPELAVHVLRPGLDMGKVAHGARAELRRRWGIEDGPAGARTRVVALLSDPPQAADAIGAGMAVGLADQTYADRPDGLELKLLVHPDQFRRRRAQATSRHVGKPRRLIQEPALAQPWEVLPGCDVALVAGPYAGGMSLLWGMAANIPIVAEATYAVSEIVEDRHSALLAKPDEPKALAHRLRQVLDDRQLAWKLRDTARHEAYSFFSRQRYCQSVLAVYEQLTAGKPVEVPALQVSGGLRFTGRA